MVVATLKGGDDDTAERSATALIRIRVFSSVVGVDLGSVLSGVRQSPRIRKNVESERCWHRPRLNVISRQPALSFSASGVPAGLAMKNRATERRFRGRRRLPEGAEIQKRGGLKFDLLLGAFLLFCLACDFI